MFSNRVVAFFLFLATFSLFAFATPVEIPTSSLTARTVADLNAAVARDLVVRCDTGHCTCTTPGCNEQAIYTILGNLKATVDIYVALLDGVADPTEPIAEICAALATAVQLLAAVKVNISTAGSLAVDCVNIIVAIILALATCASAYGPVVAATIAVKVDAALALLVVTVKGLIPNVVALLYAALGADITLLQTVKYVLTLVACNLPCGC